MRSPKEIQRAVDHLKEALSGGYAVDPHQTVHATTATKGLIKALEWALGSDELQGFGEMLKELDQAGPPRKPS